MNHLEETLEAVLSRGENLTLDSKVRKQTANVFLSFPISSLILVPLCSYTFSWGSLLVPHQFPELLSALLLAEQKVGCSLRWRLHEKLLQRYSCLARLLPGELLHQSFSPRIFIILTTNVSTRRYHNTWHNTTGKTSEQTDKLSSGCCGFRRCCLYRRRRHERSAHFCATTANRSSVRRWWSDWSKVRTPQSCSHRCSEYITYEQVPPGTSVMYFYMLFKIHIKLLKVKGFLQLCTRQKTQVLSLRWETHFENMLQPFPVYQKIIDGSSRYVADPQIWLRVGATGTV